MSLVGHGASLTQRGSGSGLRRWMSDGTGPRQLVVRFAVPTFVAFVLVGVVLQGVILRNSREQALATYEPAAVAAAGLVYHGLSQASPSSGPLEGVDWLPLSQLLPYQLTARHYLAASLWRADGTVLWSSQRDLVGRRFDGLPPSAAEVLRTQRPATRVVEPGDGGPLVMDRTAIVVDVPIAPPGGEGPLMVVRMFGDWAPIEQQLAASRRSIGLTLGIALVALFLVILPTAAWAGRALRRRGDELREAEQRFRELAEQSPDGLLQLSTDGELVCEYANPALERLTGRSAGCWKQDPGRVIAEAVPEVDVRAELLGGLARGSHRDSRHHPIDVPWTMPDGSTVWLAFHLARMEPDGGTPQAATQAVVIDVTPFKIGRDKLEEAVRREQQARAQLVELDELKNAFLRAVSHELRTPLASVIGMSLTLQSKRRQLPEPTTDKLVDGVVRNAQRLQRLLADLLDVDRLSQGVIELARRPADVAEVVRGVVEAQEPSSHPITLHAEPVTLDVHAASIERVMENLLANAVRHTPPGTPITVEVRPDGERAYICVADQGPGIPADLVDTIFDPFVQGPSSRADANPGTGIGLSLVQRLVALHGGSVRVESNDETGSRFVVRL